MTLEEVQSIIDRYVRSWNAEEQPFPLWVVLANPGDSLQIPGIAFGSRDQPVAGMEVPVRAHLIVLNKNMRPESLLSTFLHEFGHARYRVLHKGSFQSVDSEVAAISHSLESLASEGLHDLARQEARAVVEMGIAEPYKSAIEQLAALPLWVKYAGTTNETSQSPLGA